MCAVPHSALRSFWLKKGSAACRRASLPVILDFQGGGAGGLMQLDHGELLSWTYKFFFGGVGFQPKVLF